MNLSTEILNKIKTTNKKAAISKGRIDSYIDKLSNIFSRNSMYCGICGYGLPINRDEWSQEEKLKYHKEEYFHPFVNSIELSIGEYIDDSNPYEKDINQEDGKVTGLAIHESRIKWYETLSYYNDEYIYTDLVDLNKYQKKWIIENLDIFLSNYLKYTEEISKEYSEIEELAEKKINAIIEVLRNE